MKKNTTTSYSGIIIGAGILIILIGTFIFMMSQNDWSFAKVGTQFQHTYQKMLGKADLETVTHQEEEETQDNQENQDAQENEEDLVLSEEIMEKNTQEAIAQYLKDNNGEGEGAEITSGDEVTVDYIGRFNDKEVFDTSIEKIAKLSGKYYAQRNYEEGLTFIVDSGDMIPGFDKGVVGMKQGQTKTIMIPAAEAYGEAVVETPVPKSDIEGLIPEGEVLEVGKTLDVGAGAEVKIEIVTISGDTVTIKMDNPHPFAAKDLIFDITIKSIKKG